MKQKYSLNLPNGFLEEDSSTKGWLDADVVIGSQTYKLSFYDQTRLSQSIEFEITTQHPFFADKNIVVIPEVTLENMHAAISSMLDKKAFKVLLPEANN